MLVTPAATARLSARTLRQMTLLGVAFGVGEGVVGLMLGYHLGSSGATIGLVSAIVFPCSSSSARCHGECRTTIALSAERPSPAKPLGEMAVRCMMDGHTG